MILRIIRVIDEFYKNKFVINTWAGPSGQPGNFSPIRRSRESMTKMFKSVFFKFHFILELNCCVHLTYKDLKIKWNHLIFYLKYIKKIFII